jgi:hypothetical protein
MRIFGKGRRPRELAVTLPNGQTITLDRAFSDYSTAELAALGITPGLGGGAVAWVVPQARQSRTGREHGKRPAPTG